MARTFATGLVAAAMIVVSAAVGAEPPPSLGQGPIPPQSPEEPARAQRVVSPYWENGQGSDLPAADIRVVPGAAAAAVQARWQYNESLVELSNAVRLMQLQMESRPEFVDALDAERKAYDAMEEARRNALAPLRENAAYIANEDLRQRITQQIEDEAFKDKPDQARIEALAKLKLDYSIENRKLEAAVLEADEVYQSARRQYLDAGARVRQMRHQQAMAVMTDSTLIQLRRNVSENRINKLASAAYLRSAIRARNIAIDYATYYRSFDRQPHYYYTPYYPVDYWHGRYRY